VGHHVRAVFYSASCAAQRYGLVEAPPQLLSEDEWKLVKEKAKRRRDFQQPCVICKEELGLQPHVRPLHVITERVTLEWHTPKLRSHLTNVTATVNRKTCSIIKLSHGYVTTSGKLREKSSVLSQRLKADKELDDRTSGDRVFQTHVATIGKALSPTVDRFDVGTANVSDDHDHSRCIDGSSLMLCRSADRNARVY